MPLDPARPCVMLVAGEASGDQIAARMVAELRSLVPAVQVFGVGGPALAAAGMEIILPMERLAAMGLADVLMRLPGIYLAWRTVTQASRRRHPHVLALVDAPGFNLPLAKRLRPDVPRIVYYVSPKYWAWRRSRLLQVARLTDRQALIFPFEEEDYRGVGGNGVFVGHPVLDMCADAPSREEARTALGLEAGDTVLAMLPGSRLGELKRHLPILKDCALKLADQSLTLLLQLPDRAGADAALAAVKGISGVKVVHGRFHEVLRAADLGLVASGTASLEAAVLGLPHLVFYRLDRLAACIARRVVKIPFASPVNIVADEELVPELLNEDANGVLLANWVLGCLRTGGLREAGLGLALRMRDELGGPGASRRTAELLVEELRTAGAAC